jgi:hypothetical protein
MADTTINTTTGAVLIPEVWAREMLVARENYLVAAKCVWRFDEDVAAFGDVIHLPEVTDLVATAVSAGTDVTYQAKTENEKTITIDQHWESSFLVHDKFDAQTKYRYAQKMADKAAYALSSKIDSVVLALYASAANHVGDSATDITKENILKAIRILDAANAPQSDRHFIVDAYGKEDLFNEDDFVLYDATGKVSPAVNGTRQGAEFGQIYGVTVHISNNVPVEASSPVTIHGLMLQKEAIGLAIQKNIKAEMQRKAEKLADLYVTSVLFGAAALRTDHMVDFRYEQA